MPQISDEDRSEFIITCPLKELTHCLLTACGMVHIKCTDVFVLSFGKLLEIWSAGFLDTPFIQLSVSVSLRCMYHTSLCVCVLTMVSSSQFIDVLVY